MGAASSVSLNDNEGRFKTIDIYAKILEGFINNLPSDSVERKYARGALIDMLDVIDAKSLASVASEATKARTNGCRKEAISILSRLGIEPVYGKQIHENAQPAAAVHVEVESFVNNLINDIDSNGFIADEPDQLIEVAISLAVINDSINKISFI